MSQTETVANIVTRATERADMENSNFISAAEKRRLLNVWTKKLHSKLVKIDPERFVREQTLTGDGSTYDFSVAADYYGTVGIDYVSDQNEGIYVPLPRLFGDTETKVSQTYSGVPLGYTFRYNNTTPSTELIRLMPTPDSSTLVRHRYIVTPPTYATDGTDDAELVWAVAGYEEYVVLGMARDMLRKEKSSTTEIERDLAEFDQYFTEAAENRTIDSAGYVIDVRSEGIETFDPADWSIIFGKRFGA